MQKFTLIGILGDKSMADIQGWRSILDAYYDEKKTNRWISEWFGFAVESVAAFAWNGWQASSGISGNLGLEYAPPVLDRLALAPQEWLQEACEFEARYAQNLRAEQGRRRRAA